MFACRNNDLIIIVMQNSYGNNIGAGEEPHIFGGWSEYLYILPGSHLWGPDTLDPNTVLL